VKSKEAPVQARKFGTGKGRRRILDSDWAKPVETPEELERIEPDAFFQIRETAGPVGERQTRNFLLEADRSTMGRRERPGSQRNPILSCGIGYHKL